MGRKTSKVEGMGCRTFAFRASQSAARVIPAGDRFGERRKSPVSKPRIPTRQANVMLFFAPKQQIFQSFSGHAAGPAENCLT